MSDRVPWNVQEREVVIIGAGYGALIAGAVLARAGLRPLLIEELDQAGLPGGAYPYSPQPGETYWLDFGRRDSHGEQDYVLVTNQWHLKAAERAGVTLPIVGPHAPTMRTHRLPERVVSSFGAGTDDATRFLRENCGLDDELAQRFLVLLGELAAMDGAEAAKLTDVTFEQWFEERGEPADLRKAMYSLCVCIYSLPPEQTSVGRFVLNYAKSALQLHTMNDPEVGGMQGACQPYIRAIEEAGGEIWLNTEATCLLRDADGATGVLARDVHAFVREVRTRHVIFTRPAFQLFDLVPESEFPAGFAEQARSTRQWELPMISVQMGLSGTPIRRGDGKPDDFASWNRVMVGEDRSYAGGWIIPSLTSPKSAPPGKHLLEVCYADDGTKRVDGRMVPHSYEELKPGLERLVDYVYEFYANLEEIVEWSEVYYTTEAGGHHWAYKPGARVPKVSPIPGLYLQGYTTDTSYAYYEAEEYSALDVVDTVLAALRKGEASAIG
ncbi:phytoene desaturase family protein [Amycolatopsis thermophila]|uniref:Phytoene dehydrogenase-like protein n=1 Tax=Amycolatopsis thermophila TaxID=206084 RepID=A0ABU0F574_9PSEU|nr:FAD-dependent oxidoreductase [Amycolatopsis thermophila]MDQ0382741.1 phytoene dehydrogenase-like protein [Amycolatopsis thermophila]